ncbi:MAG: class I SAM-dependent methyltransferase [Proteobacteria bacterium]|nr:class I SAM-dependent methyltransferase [Pseudomonadota bacterium]
MSEPRHDAPRAEQAPGAARVQDDPAEPNDAFTAFWNDVLVPKFERHRNILLDGFTHHSAVPLAKLELPRGARALDVGCGWGDTTIELARKAGDAGAAVGLDCCEAFLQKGRADAAAAGLCNVSFIMADVQTFPFAPEFDFAFSRFGTMFFANPVAALRNIRRALKPGASFMFIAWRAIGDNPFFDLPKKVVSRFLPPPGDDARNCGPGPFSMADSAVVAAQVRAAGFTDFHRERVDGEVMVGADLAQAVAFQLALGPAGEIVREAGATADACRSEIEAALADALAPFVRDDGVRMMSSSWTYVARNPAPDAA